MQLSGKERLFRVFRHETADRVPWVPFAGIHAGKLKNYTATEILSNKDKLMECLLEVNRQYIPDGQPIVFDLQIEAEILGCGMKWADKAPPSVTSHPLASGTVIPEKMPLPTEGRLPLILEVMKMFKKKVGNNTALFGLICGPLTLAMHLRGTAFFMDLIRNKEYAEKLLDYARKVCEAMASYYIQAGMDIIAVVDPVVSQVSTRHFIQFLSKPISQVFTFIREKKVFSSFFVCGDATRNIEAMCLTKPDSIFVDENIKMEEAKKITDQHNIILGGNIPLTTTMLYGSQQDCMKYVVNMLDKLDHRNLVIAPGCDLPYDTPIDNMVGVQQAVSETAVVKKTLEDYQSVQEDIQVTLPDYAHLKKPLIEVFTLDSDVCAACGYMRNAGLDAKAHFGERIDMVEYKIIYKENIARVKKMKLEHLPSLLINGQLKYSSIIPNQDDLFREIEAVLKKK